MNRRNFFTLVLGNVAWLVTGCGKVDDSSSANSNTSPPPSQPDKKALRAYQEENRAQIAAATQRAAEQKRLADAVAETPDYRAALQVKTKDQWLAFIHKYLPTFKTLRDEAAQSPSHTVPCAICAGRGLHDFCFVCNDAGKCPTCKGSGNISNNGICPTCQGTGKCFLCHGSGKMPCPFCDDGAVYANQPMPPYEIPIG